MSLLNRISCSIHLHIMLSPMVRPSLRHWHNVLSEALWAHRISKHHATKVSPFELVFGQEVVLLVEVSLNAIRFARKNDLVVGNYHDLMMDNTDEVTEKG
jgi:hypothetical protein